MTRKLRLQKLGWRTEKIMDGETWLGFWRLVKPDGTYVQGWDMPEYPWPNGYHFNCFDGENEAWEFAER